MHKKKKDDPYILREACIQIEPVTPRQSIPCSVCGMLPRIMRVKCTYGSGRFAKVVIYCHNCGADYMHSHRNKVKQMETILRGGINDVDSP